MVTKITYDTFDDLTGAPDAKTISFSLGSASYEIDLADDGAALRKALEPFIAAARRPSRRGAPAVNRAPAGDQTAVREWAATNGFTVATRGRIPKKVLDAYASRTQ